MILNVPLNMSQLYYLSIPNLRLYFLDSYIKKKKKGVSSLMVLEICLLPVLFRNICECFNLYPNYQMCSIMILYIIDYAEIY